MKHVTSILPSEIGRPGADFGVQWVCKLPSAWRFSWNF